MDKWYSKIIEKFLSKKMPGNIQLNYGTGGTVNNLNLMVVIPRPNSEKELNEILSKI